MSKRFLMSGRAELKELEKQILEFQQSSENSRAEIITLADQEEMSYIASFALDSHPSIITLLKEKHNNFKKLEKDIQSFSDRVADKHQPVQKLCQATVHFARNIAIDRLMSGLALISTLPALSHDRQITMGGRMAGIRTEFIVLNDKFIIAQALKSGSSIASLKFPGGAPGRLAAPFFRKCTTFIGDCNVENLPKLAVEATVFYASIARAFQSFRHSAAEIRTDRSTEYVEIARELLAEAQELCKNPFQDVDILREAVDKCIKLLRKPWYEEVSAEEIASIKAAMVSGPGGIVPTPVTGITARMDIR